MFKLKTTSTSLTYYAPRMRASYTNPHSVACPVCNGAVERVRRRWVDRLISLALPLQRYRCQARGWGCDWEGNLRY